MIHEEGTIYTGDHCPECAQKAANWNAVDLADLQRALDNVATRPATMMQRTDIPMVEDDEKVTPSGPTHDEVGLEEVADLIRQHSLILGNDETLVIQMGPSYTPQQLHDVAAGLRDVPFGVLVVPGDGLAKTDPVTVENAVRNIIAEETRKAVKKQLEDEDQRLRMQARQQAEESRRTREILESKEAKRTRAILESSSKPESAADANVTPKLTWRQRHALR